ncbi:MAG: hypothetical protein JW915_21670 [Chitinispirillaceae bacterium]|nr:hypothetical protein [Chitinispirillaceae bacterium]
MKEGFRTFFLKNVKKSSVAGVVIVTMATVTLARIAVTPYISPGIEIGFGKVISPSITTKISIGINTPGFQFVNLTYGRIFTIKTNVPQMKNGIRFLEVEGGTLIMIPEVFFIAMAGGGAGVAFHNDNGVKILPKISLFGGSVLSFRTDLFWHPKLKSHAIWNHGLMLVAPVSPLFFDWD